MDHDTDETFGVDLDRLVGRYAQRIGQAELEAEVAGQRLEAALKQRDELAAAVAALEARLDRLEGSGRQESTDADASDA